MANGACGTIVLCCAMLYYDACEITYLSISRIILKSTERVRASAISENAPLRRVGVEGLGEGLRIVLQQQQAWGWRLRVAGNAAASSVPDTQLAWPWATSASVGGRSVCCGQIGWQVPSDWRSGLRSHFARHRCRRDGVDARPGYPIRPSGPSVRRCRQNCLMST